MLAVSEGRLPAGRGRRGDGVGAVLDAIAATRHRRDAMFAQVRHGREQAAGFLHLLLFISQRGVLSGQRQRRGDAPVRRSRGALCMNQFTAPSPWRGDATDLLVDLCTGLGPRRRVQPACGGLVFVYFMLVGRPWSHQRHYGRSGVNESI